MSAHRLLYEAGSALEELVPDPGNGGTIQVKPGKLIQYLRLTSTSGAETRALDAPTAALPRGSRLCINYAVDGGTSVVIAVTDGVNQAGNDEITFADHGDYCELVVTESQSGYRWSIGHNDGVAVS